MPLCPLSSAWAYGPCLLTCNRRRVTCLQSSSRTTALQFDRAEPSNVLMLQGDRIDGQSYQGKQSLAPQYSVPGAEKHESSREILLSDVGAGMAAQGLVRAGYWVRKGRLRNLQQSSLSDRRTIVAEQGCSPGACSRSTELFAGQAACCPCLESPVRRNAGPYHVSHAGWTFHLHRSLLIAHECAQSVVNVAPTLARITRWWPAHWGAGNDRRPRGAEL